VSVAVDYRNPDYVAIIADRAERLARLRGNPKTLAALKTYYSTHPWDFIRDWGTTYDPRNIERGLPASIPFIPFDRQIEFLQWLYERWTKGERGLVEKSRDMGVSWLLVGFAASMWLFRPGFAAGFGSRKEEYVDKKGDPKSIFDKIRPFIASVPVEFRPAGYNERDHALYMRIINPENGATITGEAGDNIGRGGRQSVYFVDEAAFVENQESVDAALSQTTNCQIDVSTPNGNGNVFYKKRHSGKVPVFEFDWRSDPRKDQAWYDKQCAELDEVIVAQEIDRDYNASAENVFIPAKWVKASIDAHIKLGFAPSGIKVAAFDPADTGDAKARLFRHGSVILDADEMRRGDIRDAVPWVRDWAIAKRNGCGLDAFVYDADGMGAPIVKLSIEDEFSRKEVPIFHFHGSSGVEDPDSECEDLKKLNKDGFANYRAQTYYRLRRRFERTYEAVERGIYQNPDDLISISSACSCKDQLVAELSRPQRLYTGSGKIIVEGKQHMRARGVASPNLSDGANMAFSVRSVPQSMITELTFRGRWR
jgi:hypothetical protein